MAAYIEVISGKYSASTIAIEEGAICRIGRSTIAEMVLPDDFTLADTHFALSFDGFSGKLFALGSKEGVFHNGVKVFSFEINEPCKLLAGETK